MLTLVQVQLSLFTRRIRFLAVPVLTITHVLHNLGAFFVFQRFLSYTPELTMKRLLLDAGLVARWFKPYAF